MNERKQSLRKEILSLINNVRHWIHHDCKDKSKHKFFCFKIVCMDSVSCHC